MAVVYKAEDVILGRTVALKTLHERYAEDRAFQRRFKQEARAMASLDHPNVVGVYDISQDGEVPIIVAECIEGEDVGRLLSRCGRLQLERALEIAEQLLSALTYAHERGIVHRDIKPSNILVTADGTVKVADFGIASMAEETPGEPWESGEIIGSARYMAPEQLTGGTATPRSDLYSVGILLYHCLTGEPPFSGDTKTVARRQLREQPLAPHRLNRRVPPELGGELLKALSKDPEDRHASASDMQGDLQRAFADSPKTGGVPAAISSFLGERRRLLLAPAVVAVLLAGGGMAYGLSGNPEGGQPLSATGPVESAPIEAPAPEGETEPAENEDAAPEAGEPEAAEEYVQVPNTDRYFDYWATEVLESRGFEVEVVYEYKDRYANRGVTWGTEPMAGTEVPAGSTITVYSTPKDRSQPQL